MKKLSEKELLLLSNYIYIDESTKYETINDLLNACRKDNGNIDIKKVSNLTIGGAMTRFDCADLLKEIDSCSDEFKNLSVARSIDKGGIRGVCFTGINDSNPTLVFRGTGNEYKAWSDNVKGEYMSDTEIQKLAGDFLMYNCEQYENITVTGHSKGGNLAQYVTVIGGDKIRRCVSFDGQGFGQEFIEAYGDEIERSSKHIKSICAHNDYVNILLTPIAGEIVYVDNKSTDFIGRHSSFSLLESCEFDEYGEIRNLRKQDMSTKILGFGLGSVVSMIDKLPKDGNEKTSNVLAAAVASMLSDDRSDLYETGKLNEAMNSLGKYVLNCYGLNNDKHVHLCTTDIFVNEGGMKEAVEMLRMAICDMKKFLDLIMSERYSINYKAASKIAVDINLKRVEERLSKDIRMLNLYMDSLDEIGTLYKRCENNIIDTISSGTVSRFV